MKTNTKVKTPAPRTHEGAVAARINPEQMLRRSVLSCLLWEDEHYEEGQAISRRIAELVPKCSPEFVSELAIETRTKGYLRHAPLWLAVAMCESKPHRKLVGKTLEGICLRADEPAEFLAMYWKKGKKKLPAQVKKGLAKAMQRYSSYQLAKYDRPGSVRIRDVIFLCHPKPKDQEQQEVWNKLVAGKLPAPDTWEVNLSAGKDKGETFARLIDEKKLGPLALLRNLRNMTQAKVDEAKIRHALRECKADKVLPFRFIAAARHNPRLESDIEVAMMRCLEQQPKLAGRTVLIVDVSGSMTAMLSAKSEINRMETAFALAILAREMCEDVAIYVTAGSDAYRKHATSIVPSRHGFALRDAMAQLYSKLGGGGIFLHQVMEYTKGQETKPADRVIVITDEQDCDLVNKPTSAKPFGKHNYLINVASARNGIGYGQWTHIDGFSESVMAYIQACENQQ